ncbi:dual specificity protein phosphatase 23 [Penaeus vannamei]|uniref:dual specificity protein phosphatase 23 n=1 Tax=Penaeus vannamei TaxID=6689 RepID=UPI00387F8E15
MMSLFYNFSWLVEGKICGSDYPWSEVHLDFLRKQKVGVIVTLTEEERLPATASNDFECHLVPIIEFEPPSIEQMCHFISICDAAQEQKKAVYVHCRRGQGRTGTLLACYLVKYQQQPPAKAILMVREMRPGSIENLEQVMAVHKYWNFLNCV